MTKAKNIMKASDELIAARTSELIELFGKMKAQVTSEVVFITSTIAKEWLKKNVMNRNLDNGRKNSYIRQLLDGVWAFNGQTIIFSDTDKLLDGQGRLTAVAESGLPIVSLVVKGVPEEAFATMDIGKVRTFNDVLSASHILGETSATHQSYTAYIVKKVMEWKNNRKGSHGFSATRNTSNNSECFEDARENLRPYSECAKKAMSLFGDGKTNLMPNGKFYGSVMAYLNLICGWSIEEIYPFFKELVDEYGAHPKGQPTTTLRVYLRKKKEGSIKISDKEMYHMFARAWNSYINGETIQRFCLKNCEDEFMQKEEYEVKNEKKRKIAVQDELEYEFAKAL